MDAVIGPAAPTATGFDYERAFSRNLGLVQPEEQTKLRHSRVAIAGLGGVGGVHLTTLARMGIGSFHIADFDRFEMQNFNRQAGALMSTLGEEKTTVMEAMARDINPDLVLKSFREGITEANIADFLKGVDVVVDGLDFFAVAARDLLYRETYRRDIPVVAAGPIGCSSAYLVFLPGGMRWQDYFAMDLARNEVDKYILFFIGNTPAATQSAYIDPRYIKLAEKSGPSLALGVQLCAGTAAAETMKLLLGRGRILAAPYYHQYDAYLCKYVVGKLRWGNRGPLQRLKLARLRKVFAGSPLTAGERE